MAEPAKVPETVPPISEQIKTLANSLNTFLVKVPIAKKLSDQSGQPPAVLAAAAAALLCVIILYSHGFDALCNLIGFSYPLYASFKSLKTVGAQDDTEWLTYWVVFGFFIVVEDFADVIFERNVWSVVYFMVKIVFLLWLQLPQYKGSNIVYNRAVNPALKYFEGNVDAQLKAGGELADQAGKQAEADLAERAIANATQNSKKKAT